MDPGTPEIKKAHPHTVSAAKVAEVLKAAGEAFCRLGECTMMLDNQSTPTKSKVRSYSTRYDNGRINNTNWSGC